MNNRGKRQEEREGVTSIRVAVRVRPPVHAEIGRDEVVFTEMQDVGAG